MPTVILGVLIMLPLSNGQLRPVSYLNAIIIMYYVVVNALVVVLLCNSNPSCATKCMQLLLCGIPFTCIELHSSPSLDGY